MNKENNVQDFVKMNTFINLFLMTDLFSDGYYKNYNFNKQRILKNY